MTSTKHSLEGQNRRYCTSLEVVPVAQFQFQGRFERIATLSTKPSAPCFVDFDHYVSISAYLDHQCVHITLRLERRIYYAAPGIPQNERPC